MEHQRSGPCNHQRRPEDISRFCQVVFEGVVDETEGEHQGVEGNEDEDETIIRLVSILFHADQLTVDTHNLL